MMLSTKLDTSVDVDSCYKAESLGSEVAARDCPENSPSRRFSSLILSILTTDEAQQEARCSSAGQKLSKYISELSADEKAELMDNLQVQHYLHRLVQHGLKSDKHNKIVTKLAEYFPEKVKDYRGKELPVSYSYSDMGPQSAPTKKLRNSIAVVRPDPTAPSDIFQYDPSTLPATFRAPKVTLDKVRNASFAVAEEVRLSERAMCDSDISAVKRGTSMPLRDVSTRLLTSGHRRQSSRARSLSEKTKLVPVLRTELGDPQFRLAKSRKSLFDQKHKDPLLALQQAPISASGLPLKTAFDVIEAFASGQLGAESESVYLNYTRTEYYNPYDLTVTLRTKAEPEHYVISNFGIIHVYPDGMSDFESFADWLREASMFTLMKQIPFFREYGLRHAFRLWQKAVRCSKLQRLQIKLNKISIRFFPIYAEALLKLKHLSEELLTIPFHNLKPLGGYTVDVMEHSLNGSQTKAQQFLFKYFKYCRRVVCAAVDASRKHASDLEGEQHQQRFVPEVPLSIQRKSHERLERDLEAATYQKERVGDFVYLAEQIVYSCLLQLARDSADSWKELFLDPISKQPSSGFHIRTPRKQQTNIGSKHSDQKLGDYFLLSSLIIDSTGKVTTDPQSSRIKGIFTTFFHDMTQIITSIVHQLDLPLRPSVCVESASRVSTRGTSTFQSNSFMPLIEPKGLPAVHRESRKFLEIPPSLAPAKQPRVVLKALRAFSTQQSGKQFAFTVSDQEQTGRNMLITVEQSDTTNTGTVQGSVMKRRNSVLCRPSFMESILNDDHLKLVMKEVEVAAEKVSQQMESICQENEWLSRVWEFNRMWRDGQQWDIWEFIRGWSNIQRGVVIEQGSEEGEYNSVKLADEFEVTLNQLYKWRNQFVAFPAEIVTPYAMLCISSSSLVEMFCSTLITVQNQVKSAAITRSRHLCEKVLEETKERVEMLCSKRYDLEGFAEYAHYLRESHAFQSREFDNITFVLKVHSILQRQGIQVPHQDKELGREVREVWQAFEQKLAEADFFVSKQTPMKAQGLQESIMSSEDELRALVEKVHQGDFIDPTQDSSHLIELLDKVYEEVGAVHARLLGLSKWKEAITGLPHDLSNVNSLLDQVYVRQELWKYRRHFDYHEKEWMSSAFKKLDITSISTRVTDWLEACVKLGETLGENDPVLVEWRERLNNLKRGMPLLLQLSSNYLKTSHWVTIFASLGEDYEPGRQYTLTDFALYNIYDHTSIIFEICYDAMQGEKLKGKVIEIQKELESTKINIIQLPLECYPFALRSSTPTPTITTTGSGGGGGQGTKISFKASSRFDIPVRKGATFAVGLASPSDSDQFLYKIENGEEVVMKLENSAVQLKLLLTSPHIGALKLKADISLNTVSKLLEMVQLLLECQKQWEHLLDLVKLAKQHATCEGLNLTELQKAGAKYQDIAKSIRIDSRLLSLMEKRRGQKGFRELQGEALRNLCKTILELLGSATVSVRELLTKGIEQCPRLSYLSDQELLATLSHIGDPSPLIPVIRKLFPGVGYIRFTEVVSNKNTPSFTLTATTEEEGFQIVFVKDWQKAQLPLCVPLSLGKKPAPQWLNGLEYAISYSLGSVLSETYFTLPALLKGLEVQTEHQAVEVLQWLDKHLNQCVYLSMELHWTLVLHAALTSDEPIEQLNLASTKLSTALESVVEVLLRRGEEKRQHLSSTVHTLQHIILTLRHKSEMVLALLAEDICTPESFQWRTQLHYSTETENLFTLPDQATTVRRMTLGSDLNSSTHSNLASKYSITTSQRGQSALSRGLHESSSQVTLSRSLVSSKNAVMGQVSGVSFNEFNRSTGTRSVAGCPTPLKCFLHCHQTTLPYGFEFLGSDTHLVLTPHTESALLSLVSAVAGHAYPTISLSSRGFAASSTGKDVAVALGRHLHTVDCCLLTDAASLRRLLFGALHTGSILQLNNLHQLPHLLNIHLAKWLETVAKALAKIPPFMEKEVGRTSTQERANTSSTHASTQRETCQTIPKSQSPDTRPISVTRPSEYSSSMYPPPAPRTATTTALPTASSLLSQQSSRLLQSRLTERTHTRGSTRMTTRLDWYQLSQECRPEDVSVAGWCGYGGEVRRPVELLESEILHVSPAFGCVLVSDTAAAFVPEQLKVSFRQVEVLEPDWTYLSEALLVSHGFSAAQELGTVISQFLQQLQHQLLSTVPEVSTAISPSVIAHIVSGAGQLLRGNDSSSLSNTRLGFNVESRCVMTSALQFFAPRLDGGKRGGEEEEEEEEEEDELFGMHARTNSTGWNKLRELLASFFPGCDVDYPHHMEACPMPSELVEAIRTQLQERHLQNLTSLMEKIKQLHYGLQQSKCVLLTGPCGSGKTTCFRILAAAYQQVKELQALSDQSRRISMDTRSDVIKYPTVTMTYLNPAAFSMEELLGSVKEISRGGQSTHQLWQDGVLTTYLKGIQRSHERREVTLHPDVQSNLQTIASAGAPMKHWLILDGPVGPLLSELLHHLATDEGVTLKNGEKLCLPKSCQLIVECPSLEHVSPSLLASCPLVHCSRDTLSFNAIINTWLDKAPTQHNLSAICAETLAIMIRQLVPETLDYLVRTNTKQYGDTYTVWSKSQVYGLTETQCFLSLLSAVLERNAPKEEVGLGSTRGTGTLGYNSRASSALSDSRSRAGSVMFTHSTTSLQTDASYEHSVSGGKQDEEDNLSEISNLEAEMALSMQVQMAAMLSFAYIWSLGAFVPYSESQGFSELARELIMQLPYAVPLPDEGSVFDYYLDLKHYHFLTWAERRSESRRHSGGYVALPELDRFAYLTDLYVSYDFDVLLTGDAGTGKSSFVNYLLKSRMSVNQLPINHLSTPTQLQRNVIEKLTQIEKRSGQRWLASSRHSQQRVVFFLDDLHLTPESSASDSERAPSPHTGPDYPLLELLRYMLTHRRLTDFSRAYEHLLSPKFLATSTNEGYWRLPVRLTKGLCRLPFLPPSDQSLHQIFSSNISPWLEGFPIPDISQMAEALSAASVTVYRSVRERFHPSSLRPHHSISMHHLLTVFEGLLLLTPDTKAQRQFGLLNRRGFLSSVKTPQKKHSLKLKSARKSIGGGGRKSSKKVSNKLGDKVNATEADSTLRMLVRLWCHETTRVYLDRNTDSKERIWFLKLLESCIKYCFCGVKFEEGGGGGGGGGGLMSRDRRFRQGTGGHTASFGNRRARGSRARGGGPVLQAPAEGLNEEELVGSGVKVDTLKKLLPSTPGEEQGEGEGEETKESGPPKLISLDQITVKGEDLTGLIFAQFPSPPQPQAPSSTSFSSQEESSLTLRPPEEPSASGYTELGDGQVMEVLSKHLETFRCCPEGGEEEGEGVASSSVSVAASGIVLYREAIEHCARLYRIMSIPGANALLLGVKGSGRKTLIRLMAYIRKSKIFELDSTKVDQLTVKQTLREACISAAVESQHTLLVVSSHTQLSFSEWHSIASIMNEGLYPGLFTSSELLVMSGKLQAGKMKRTAQMAYQAFSREVSTRLHVLVLWDIDSINGSLFSGVTSEDPLSQESSLRALFQALCRSCSYIDHYLPWSKHSYSEIALQCWQKASSAVKWQDWAETSSQLEAISSLAAHVHITTSELLTRTYGELARHLVTPRLFTQCLAATQSIALKLRQDEMVDVKKFQAAVKKLQSVDEVVVGFDSQLSVLQPKLQTAESVVQQKMELITGAKERYMEANRRCKVAEETIEYETTNVKCLSEQVDEKVAEVEPVYEASLEALSAVTLNEILEFNTYRSPPTVLFPLFNTICMLFDREESWEECQQLMMAHNFLESMRFFDRDRIPKQKVQRLEKVIRETSRFKDIGLASRAAIPLGMWISALLDYHKVITAVEPLKEKLRVAEETLLNARRTFVDMQKDMYETKGALESTIKEHKDSVKKARLVESDISIVVAKRSDAQSITNTMAGQRRMWEEQLSVISSRINSIPGHAMVSAASMYYLSRAPPDKHKELLSNWLGYCSGAVPLGSLELDKNKLQSAQGYGAFSGQQQVVRIQKDFSLATGLSTKEERANWQQEGTFPDESILDRFLSSRAFCTFGFSSWPLVFDPYDQFSEYLGAPEEHCLVLKASDSSLVDKLETATLKGGKVLLYVDEFDHANFYSQAERTFLTRLLQRQVVEKDGRLFLTLPDYSVHSNLQLYMVVRATVSSAVTSNGVLTLSPFFKELAIRSFLDGSIVDIELKHKALESMFHKFVLSHERPEYLISHRSLLTDLTLHQQALEASQAAVLEYILDPAMRSLLDTKDLLDRIRDSEAAEAAAQEQIREAKRNLHTFEQNEVAYRPLSSYASIILTSVQKVAAALLYFDLGVEEFKDVLSSTIQENKKIKVPDHAMSIKAHVIHLKGELLLNIYKMLQMHVFERHQLLVPLLVALNVLLEQGEVTEKELELLGRTMGGVEAQLDLAAAGDTGKNNLASKPQWISDKSWCKALELQREVPTLRRLAIELSDSSTEWREYFELRASIMGPLPGFGASCTLAQKMLLWKVFKPEKFHEIIKEFILVTSGGDYVKTKLPSFDEVLSLTEPRSPTLLLQAPDSPDSSPVVAKLKNRAIQDKLDCRQWSLHSKEKWRELLKSLPRMAVGSCWVIVEHCHLLPNCQEVLTSIVEKLEDLEEAKVHQKFRVWLMMPVEFVSKHRISGCKSVISLESKMSDDAQLSSQVLYDLRGIFCSSAHKYQGLWANYSSAVTKLKTFIPTVLPQSELHELDPQHNSAHSVPSLIHEELCLHNQSIAFLLSSLEKASDYLQNKVLLSNTIGRTILSLASDSIPTSWTHVLPKPLAHMTSLMSAVKLLKARMEFYKRTLNSGTLPSKLNPLLFSNPQNLVSGRVCTFAAECQLSTASVVTEGKLVAASLVEKQPQGLALFGLSLRHATWDRTHSCLRPRDSSELEDMTSYCAIITCSAQDQSHPNTPAPSGGRGDRTQVYDCPVVLANRNMREGELPHSIGQTRPLFHVPLPLHIQTGAESQGVCLLCDSELHDAYM